MSDAFGEPTDDDTMAGEYVLGVLEADEMAAVRARARDNATLRAAIARWETQLAPLAAMVAPAKPPTALWDRLAAATAVVPMNDEAVRPTAANENAPGARRRLWPWQLSTAASLALAAGLGAFAVLRPQPGIVRIAALAPIGAHPPAFVAQARADGRVTLAAISPDAVPAGRELELWVLPPGATKVASVGLLRAAGQGFDLGPPPATGTQFFVSLEQTGGSTTGQPGGPVLYGGTVASIDAEEKH